jgi:Rhodopirellula transposase DDE domain
MKLELTSEVKSTIQKAFKLLKGSSRRFFMASVVVQLDKGGQRLAEHELGWNRDLIRKGLRELKSGMTCVDNFSSRGRKLCEDLQPALATDIREIVDSHCETDPTFRTTRLYRRLTAKEVCRQLVEDKGYRVDQIPGERSMRDVLSRMGFHPRKVVKSKPLRKIKETDAIFNEVHRVNKQADADPGTIRLSIDTKAVVDIGDLSRGGKSRQGEQTLDHDFAPESQLTPFGVFRPDTSETWLYFTSGPATADFMVDRLQELWPDLKKTVILRIPW